MPMPDRLSSHAYISLSESNETDTFKFNSKIIKARSDDTIASALHAAGIKILSRSFKYHRPRGLYDAYGLGPDLLLAVDGMPNVRGDKTLVKEGMDVGWCTMVFFIVVDIIGRMVDIIRKNNNK